MKVTFTLLVLMLFVAGFGLIGDALAQPDNPTPAASGSDSPAGEPASGEVKPEEPKPDEAKPPADKGESPEAPKAEGEKEGEATPPDGAVDQAKSLFSAVKGGQWMLAFAFASMLLGSILRWGMKMKWKFWESKAGGYVIAGVMGLATLGTMIATTGSFSLDALWAAAAITAGAMGLHAPGKAVKNKLKPEEATG